jgi:hypothetical protein
MKIFDKLRMQAKARAGCGLCIAALAAAEPNYALVDEHHPSAAIPTLAMRTGMTAEGNPKLERVGYYVEAQVDPQTGASRPVLHFCSPFDTRMPWYSYALESLRSRIAAYDEAGVKAREFVLCDGAGGGYSRSSVSLTSVRRIIEHFDSTHPMFRTSGPALA